MLKIIFLFIYVLGFLFFIFKFNLLNKVVFFHLILCWIVLFLMGTFCFDALSLIGLEQIWC
jgi:hypothetical protein